MASWFGNLLGAPPPGNFASENVWENDSVTHITLGKGRFTLLKDKSRYLGRGMSALVFEGEDTSKDGEDRVVAIKVG